MPNRSAVQTQSCRRQIPEEDGKVTETVESAVTSQDDGIPFGSTDLREGNACAETNSAHALKMITCKGKAPFVLQDSVPLP